MNRALVFAAALLAATASAETKENEVDFATWLQKSLKADSKVKDWQPDGKAGQSLSTEVDRGEKPGEFLLVYERLLFDHEDDRGITTRQFIKYPFALKDLDGETVEVVQMEGSYSDQAFFVLQVHVTKLKEFIPYKNIFEANFPDGSSDISTSEGKARGVAIGYFSNREKAVDIGKRLSAAIQGESAGSKARPEEPDRGPAEPEN